MEKIIWDILIAAIVILFVIAGAKKGFAKPVIVFLVNAACIAGAFVFANMTAQSIYEMYIQDSVTANIEESLKEFDVYEEIQKYYSEVTIGFEMTDKQLETVLSDDESMDKKLINIIKNETGSQLTSDQIYKGLYDIINNELQEKMAIELPPCAGRYFEELNDKDTVFELLNILSRDEREAAEYIEKNFAGKVMVNFIKIVSIVLVSIILTVIVQLIMNAILFKNEELKAFTKADMFAGGILGLVKGVVFCIVMAFAIKMFIYSGVSGKVINDTNIQSSVIFKYFYNINEIISKK